MGGGEGGGGGLSQPGQVSGPNLAPEVRTKLGPPGGRRINIPERDGPLDPKHQHPDPGGGSPGHALPATAKGPVDPRPATMCSLGGGLWGQRAPMTSWAPPTVTHAPPSGGAPEGSEKEGDSTSTLL